MNIRRLHPDDAAAIVDCFRRVYGDSYANELFHEPESLAERMREQSIGSVGAIDDDGVLIGHMAMTILPGARTVELGNTVVDPAARGQGIAWQIGAALKDWCVELGYRGYLHYPTTSHDIMQRQSVKRGFETGLMLGYIPAETVEQAGGPHHAGRQAATIVHEPLPGAGADAEADSVYLPDHAAGLIQQFSRATGLHRRWLAPGSPTVEMSIVEVTHHARRGLDRMRVTRVGEDLSERLGELERRSGSRPEGYRSKPSCWQIDFSMDDPGINVGVAAARGHQYWFCGWLPAYGQTDVLRMQKVDRSATDMAPGLVNPVARSLLELIPPD